MQSANGKGETSCFKIEGPLIPHSRLNHEPLNRNNEN